MHWRLPCGMWHICGACVTPPCASPPAPPLLKIATSRVAPSVGFCLIENRKSTNYEIPSGWHFPAFLRVHLLHLAIEQINRYIYCSMCIWYNPPPPNHCPRRRNKPAYQLVFNLRILFPTCSISSLLLISIIYLANKQTTAEQSERNRKLENERECREKNNCFKHA